MKNVRKLSVFLVVLLLLVGMLPSTATAVYEQPVINVGTQVLFVGYNAEAAAIYENPALGLWDNSNKAANVWFGGVWDRDNLYIAMDKQAAAPSITLNGKTVADAVSKNTETHTLVKIPFASAEVFVSDYGYSCNLSLAIGGVSWNGILVLESTPASENFVFTGEEKGTGDNGTVGAVKSENTIHMWDFDKEAKSANYCFRGVEALKSDAKNSVFEFDFTPVKLPVNTTVGSWNFESVQGMILELTDETNATVRCALNIGIANVKGQMTVTVGTYPRLHSSSLAEIKTYPLGIAGTSKETLHVRVEYENEDAYFTNGLERNDTRVKIYINGRLIVDQNNAKQSGCSTSVPQTFSVTAYALNAGNVEFNISNIKIGRVNPDELDNTVLQALTFQNIKGENLSENGITSDLTLPVYVPGGKLNGIELEWSSNNTDAMDNTGKVNLNAVNKQVELTAKVKGGNATKTFYLSLCDDALTVPFSKDGVTLDGSLNDRGWVFADEMRGKGNPISVGTLWTDTDLFIGLEKIDTANMTLLVNGKKIETVNAKTGDKYTEIQIPLSEVGVEAAIGKSVPITILANDVEWIGAFTFGEGDDSVPLSDIFAIALAAVAVVIVALVIVGIIKRALFKKIWYIIIIAVLVIAGVVCGIFMFQEPTFDDGKSALPKFEIPDGALSNMMPKPESQYGNVISNTADQFMVEVLEVSPFEFAEYVKQAKKTPFSTVLNDMDACYAATDAEGYALNINYIENEEKMYVAVSGINFLPLMNYTDIRDTNMYNSVIDKPMLLPGQSPTGEALYSEKLVWTSSNPRVISLDGKISRPDFGIEVVTLTATVQSTGEKKIFTVRVPGYAYNDGTLTLENDTNPAAGIGKTNFDSVYNLDGNNNSIIADLGTSQKVNYVKLTEDDQFNRLVSTTVTLWVSDDNLTYTQIRDFKMLKQGRSIYLYDFETTARYVKAHYTMYDANLGTTFGGALGEMIRTGYDEVFGGNGATFTTTEYTLSNNTGKDRVDYAFTVSKDALGITGTDASIRIYLGEEQLYHYVNGDNVVIRIPEIKQGASVTLKVMFSDSNETLDVANKENVYEVTYGSKEIWNSTQKTGGQFVYFIEKGTKFADGSVLEADMLFNAGGSALQTSVDGGRTWQHRGNIFSNPSAGGAPVKDTGYGVRSWLFDEASGRIICSYIVNVGQLTMTDGVMFETYVAEFMYSDDGGKTWNKGGTAPYSLNPVDQQLTIDFYVDAVKSPGYDGINGPGVDYIIPASSQWSYTDVQSGYHINFLYTRDCGTTWERTDNYNLRYEKGHEYGVTESDIYVRDDGVLVCLARCQYPDVYQLAVLYSTDNGVNWTDPVMSDIYSVNTQPLMQDLVINGEVTNMLSLPGHNALGGASYTRSPLIFANSTNGGETFRNYQNVVSQTHLLDFKSSHLITNTNFNKVNGGQDLYMAWNHPIAGTSGRYFCVMTDFDKWYTGTKGAYDSFENAAPLYENWVTYTGTVETSADYATDGRYSMACKRLFKVGRSMPYLQDGKLSLNVYVNEETNLEIQLQTAFDVDNKKGVAPVGIVIKDNAITFLGADTASAQQLQAGWNSFTFDLKLSEGKASFSLNGGEAEAMPVDLNAGDFVTFTTLLGRNTVYVDEFLVESDTQYVLTESEGDKEAANAVIEKIKAMGNDATAIKAAREAYDALTVVQRDLVNRMTLNADKSLTNYYDVLVEAEKALS